MNNREFDRRVKALNIRSEAIPAARLVLVKGVRPATAAKQAGTSHANLHRVVKRITEAEVCSECGQEIKKR